MQIKRDTMDCRMDVRGDCMASTDISIRMDADLKWQLEAFYAEMGMTMTTAFNVFAEKWPGNTA